MEDIITHIKLVILFTFLALSLENSHALFGGMKKIFGGKEESQPKTQQVDEMVMEKHPAPITNPLVSKSEGKIELKKDKKGNYLVDWKLFREYNITTSDVGKNLKKVLKNNIALKGFMIPLDYNSTKNIKEFLLVPYVPSCSHVPPPPANMIVNVKVSDKKGTDLFYAPITVIGKLDLVKSKKPADPYMPSGVFSLIASNVKESQN